MREFRPTPPTGGREPDDPWAYGSEGRPPAGPAAAATGAAPPPEWGPSSGYVHPKGATVLVLGILSMVVLPLLGPFAWAMGHSALKEIDSSGVPAVNRSTLVAGMVTGIIGTVFLVLGTLGFLAVMGLFITTASVGLG